MRQTMIRSIAPLVVSLLVATLASAGGPEGPCAVKPKNGYVPDSNTAIKIAVAVWEPIYGAEHIANEKPYTAVLANGVWTVHGAVPGGSVGGAAIAEIAQDDGRILRVGHGK
jgi:hypothetical protein